MGNRTQKNELLDPRAGRHAQTKAKIIREAWKLAARDGVAGISLGELAKRVGLRQPSLYTYFSSKNDLYDALFADGNRQLWADVVEREYSDDPREALKESARAMIAFSSADVARHHLLFQRHIPSFEPSKESYALAQAFYEWHRPFMTRAGSKRQKDMDVYTALVAGLSEQQVANDPGGDRWVRLADEIIDMFIDRLHERGGFGR